MFRHFPGEIFEKAAEYQSDFDKLLKTWHFERAILAFTKGSLAFRVHILNELRLKKEKQTLIMKPNGPMRPNFSNGKPSPMENRIRQTLDALKKESTCEKKQELLSGFSG